MVENVTANRGYQLPHEDNDLADDVARLVAAFSAIDIDVAGLLVAITNKAALDHSHTIGDVTGLGSSLDAKQDHALKGQANGYAGLDAGGKVPTAQLPAAVLGAMAWQSTWNANTNAPTIPAASAANKGHYYKVAVAGATTVDGINDWKIGDWIVSQGTHWDKIDNTDQVMSVAGLMGVITAAGLKLALQIAKGDIVDLENATTLVAGLMSGADKAKLNAVGSMANRAVTISTSAPSGGANGDIHLQV